MFFQEGEEKEEQGERRNKILYKPLEESKDFRIMDVHTDVQQYQQTFLPIL
jgi:hypothetical protein